MSQKRRFSLEQSYSFVALRDGERESERREQSYSFLALRDTERERETEMERQRWPTLRCVDGSGHCSRTQSGKQK